MFGKPQSAAVEEWLKPVAFKQGSAEDEKTSRRPHFGVDTGCINAG